MTISPGMPKNATIFASSLCFLLDQNNHFATNNGNGINGMSNSTLRQLVEATNRNKWGLQGGDKEDSPKGEQVETGSDRRRTNLGNNKTKWWLFRREWRGEGEFGMRIGGRGWWAVWCGCPRSMPVPVQRPRMMKYELALVGSQSAYCREGKWVVWIKFVVASQCHCMCRSDCGGLLPPVHGRCEEHVI